MATLKKVSKNVPVGRNTGRKTKKGNSTPKRKTKRPEARFFDVKIRIPAADYVRGKPYWEEPKYIPKFFMDAYTEKVNRAESNSKSARLRLLMGNIELLEPVLIEMAKCGKLNFLREIINK